MAKVFLPYDKVRNDALKLAKRIYDDDFSPDVIYVPLRGGAYMGNVISEFFKIVHVGRRPVFYAAVVARSYTDVHTNHQVRVDGWTYDPEHLRTGDRILFVDDIFDTGRTINYLVETILEKGLPKEDVRVAVHDYKRVHYRAPLPIQPDYWCHLMEVRSPDDDTWIHYMSHELVGLSDQEVDQHYLSADPELDAVFALFRERREAE